MLLESMFPKPNAAKDKKHQHGHGQSEDNRVKNQFQQKITHLRLSPLRLRTILLG